MEEFAEVQRYGLLFDLVSGGAVLVASGLLWRYAEKRYYVLFVLPLACLTVLYAFKQQNTRIDNTGIHYRMSPAESVENTITWDQIYRMEISPVVIYSSRVQRYDVYSIASDYGLYIYTYTQKPVIVGTNRPDEVKAIIRRYGLGNLLYDARESVQR